MENDNHSVVFLTEDNYFHRFGNIRLLPIINIKYYTKITGFLPESEDSKKCRICHYWYLDDWFEFLYFVCNNCHGLLMVALGISNVIANDRGEGYCCIVFNGDYSEADFKLNNSILDFKGYNFLMIIKILWI